MQGLHELDETSQETSEPFSQSTAIEDDLFFELDYPEPPAAAILEQNVPPEFADRPIGRKINPYEIPAGHVDLGQRQQEEASLDRDNSPESFVGNTVKGRYAVTEFLGGDENGLAYLAYDKIVEDRMVLVRVLLDGDTDAIMESILAEERVSLSHFSHPNVARLIDSGQFNGGPNFIVSEYVDALSAADILSIHGRFEPGRAARIIRQTASALNEAHQEGIIHRDLRCENLIIDASAEDAQQVKLVNFGASNGEPTPQNFGYKAPEVLSGRIATTSSDIFSLAVVAYEMLTGSLPFAGETVKELAKSQNNPIAGSSLPPLVVEVLSRALAVNAGARYPKARDFGDAFYTALADAEPVESLPLVAAKPAVRSELLQPLVAAPAVPPEAETSAPKPNIPPPVSAPLAAAETPPWKNRSPEPPQVEGSRGTTVFAIGMLVLLAVVAFGWYFFATNTQVPPSAAPTNQVATFPNANAPAANVSTEMPPLPRNIPQPPDSVFYQNSKQNLRGDLLRNFVGFTMFYPKSWKMNGPQPSEAPNNRGKFLDISRIDPNGRLKEQMLISYYPSRGTFASDAERFPELVKETNDTLTDLLPGYQMVSQGEIKFNGEWRAYEIKFQAGGETETGEKLVVWGRRLFIPAARPGVRNGFAITMLATSLAEEIRSVDDVGTRGELAGILYSFEPSQNF